MSAAAVPADPIAAAVEALKRKAADGDIKAIRALTDGTAERLAQLGATGTTADRPIVRGELRIDCPGCGHHLLCYYDHQAHHAELSLIDLTTALDKVNPKDQITRARQDTRR
jgi:fermentation-respiration switch protein FrsA (DUF1100 family)